MLYLDNSRLWCWRCAFKVLHSGVLNVPKINDHEAAQKFNFLLGETVVNVAFTHHEARVAVGPRIKYQDRGQFIVDAQI